jgi:hypothetical protein
MAAGHEGIRGLAALQPRQERRRGDVRLPHHDPSVYDERRIGDGVLERV